MKIVDKRRENVALVGDISMGTVFSGSIGDHSSIFLRTYDGAVDLKEPSKTWIDGACIVGFRKLNAELVITE